MKQKLQKLYELLIKGDSPLVEFLEKGISREQILKTISKTLIQPPEEIISLYEWKNGILETDRQLGELFLFRMGIFIPIEKSVEIYENFTQSVDYWKKGLFPLFESGGGDYFVMDCRMDSSTFKSILFISFDQFSPHETPIIYDTLESLIDSTIECFSKKAYFYSKTKASLQIDFKEEFMIIKKNNPAADFWNKHS